MINTETKNMKKYIFTKIMHGILLLLCISLLAFVTNFLAEGDPVEMYYIAHNEPLPSPEILAQKRAEAGLNDPWLKQYSRWLGHFIEGDMGRSFRDGRAVSDKIKEALPLSLRLALPSFVFTFVLAIAAAVLSAYHKGGFLDRLIGGVSFTLASIPSFVSGVILLIVFAVKLKIFPVLAMGNANGWVLPSIALSLPMIGKYTRQIRAGLIDELGAPYVTALKVRGFKPSIILFGNVLKNCLPLVFNLMAMALGYLMAGVTIVENLFAWPGLGSLVMESILFRDYPTVQAFVLISGFTYLIVNMLSDILHKLVDRRPALTNGQD